MLAVALDVSRAAIIIIGLQGIDQFFDTDAVVQQPFGVGRNVVLLVEAADAVDFDL